MSARALLLVAPGLLAACTSLPAIAPGGLPTETRIPLAAGNLTADEIAESLPAVQDFPAELAAAETTHSLVAGGRADQPELCPFQDEALPDTDRWAMALAPSDRGSVTRVGTWAYGDDIGTAWAAVAEAVRSCETSLRSEAGTRVESVAGDDTILLDILVDSVTPQGDAVTTASTLSIRRVEDAIQVIEHSHEGSGDGAPTPSADAAELRAIVGLSDAAAEGYREAFARTASEVPYPPRDAWEVPEAMYGQPVAVSIGDSYISGAASRWQANAVDAGLDSVIDRLGDAAYWDTIDGESVEGCLRGVVSPISFWPNAINLACAGSHTVSLRVDTMSGERLKPGVDSVDDGSLQGQLVHLREVADAADVRLVALSTGGNDMGFKEIVTECVTAFATTPHWSPSYCRDSDLVREAFSDEGLARLRTAVAAAVERTVAAMRESGYDDDRWSLIVQGYPSPLPPATSMRYPERGWDRVLQGGCGFWDADLDFLEASLPRMNDAVFAGVADAERATGKAVFTVDTESIFEGRRLCEQGAQPADGVPEDRLPAVAERVAAIFAVEGLVGPFRLSESLHPNYFGQLALRDCLRQAWNEGRPRSGACLAPEDWEGVVDAEADAQVRFVPAP
ncbi:MAG: hypothetical protein ACKOT0_06655 [bacterium]